MKKWALQAIKIFILAISLTLSLNGSLASAMGPMSADGCFTTHIKESIALNQSRKALYSRLSKGRSEKISNLMILTEKTTLLFTKGIEKRAEGFESVDVPILCHGLVSMFEVPPVQTEFDLSPSPLENYVKERPFLLKHSIKKAYKAKKLQGVSEVVEVELKRLKDPHYNCMERHILDSVVRFVRQVPEHSLKAKEKGLGDTGDLTWRIIKLHLMSLPVTAVLDRWAAPLQAQGINILCNDIPAL